MPKSIADLVAAMSASPANVRFTDASKVADHYFGKPRQQGSSHRIWKMPWPGDPRVNMQDDGGKAKAYQVEQLLKAIERFETRRVTPAPTATREPAARHGSEKKTRK
jgi:hypothetical protein